jgi:hypothetical protein
MTRYFFNVFNDADVIDDEGLELPSLASAKHEAIRGARGMMADHLLAGKPITLRHRIEIADASGKVLAIIPFGELITIVE